jgi:hypothetical protein
VNHFDTAVQYGNGESETLAAFCKKLKPANVAVGTKVRLPPSEFGRIADAVTMSLEGSLARSSFTSTMRDMRRIGAERPTGAGRSGASVRAPKGRKDH